jgi:hypothetical protein
VVVPDGARTDLRCATRGDWLVFEWYLSGIWVEMGGVWVVKRVVLGYGRENGLSTLTIPSADASAASIPAPNCGPPPPPESRPAPPPRIPTPNPPIPRDDAFARYEPPFIPPPLREPPLPPNKVSTWGRNTSTHSTMSAHATCAGVPRRFMKAAMTCKQNTTSV